MEVSSLDRRAAAPPPQRSESEQRAQDAQAAARDAARERKDVQISSEARERAHASAQAHQARAEHQLQARAEEQRAVEAPPSTTIAVRFGPAPMQVQPGSDGPDAIVRQALTGRSLLPQVGELLREQEARVRVEPSPAAEQPELELLGSEGPEPDVALPLMGDGKPERSHEEPALARDVRAERPVLEQARGARLPRSTASAVHGPEPMSRAAQQQKSGEARERQESHAVERGDSSADLQAVSAAAPHSGGVQNAQNEQSQRAQLPGTDSTRNVDRDRLSRSEMSLSGVVEAKHDDQLVSRFLRSASKEEPAAEPREQAHVDRMA